MPELVAAQVIESGAGLMVMAQAEPVAPLASVTFTEKVPEAVGVPVIAPVDVLRVNPAGSVPTME